MISKILLDQVASYTEKVEFEPSEINYLYGSNGTGKTTISNLIASQDLFTNSSINWKASQLDTLVYNKVFVEANFGQSKKIKGIFTLGKNSVEAYEYISNMQTKINAIDNEIINLNRSLVNISNDITANENAIIKRCWALKDTYDSNFSPAYMGLNSNKKKFLDRCIAERAVNKEPLYTVDEIIAKCHTIFSSTIKIEENVQQFNFEDLPSIEFPEILSTIIIGKENVNISALITKLNNSDWIKEGVGFLEKSENFCPFCQQEMTVNLRDEIENFFDEEYLEKCKQLENYRLLYSNYVEAKKIQLRKILQQNISIIDTNLLIAKVQIFAGIADSNLSIIDKKIKYPSLLVTLASLTPSLEDIKLVVNSYIEKINLNNNSFNNLKAEQEKLKKEVWRFTTNELDIDIESYIKNADRFIKGKEGITEKIKQSEILKNSLLTSIRGRESEVANTAHTVNEINKILKLFSFTNFSLAQATEKGFYKIIREDGSEGHETLSEGEYRFITFLYFYQLLKGSTSDSGVTSDKVVVFDDPISSLDSSVLFVVSNLIKNVIQSCKNKTDGIKQVFILTHNVYFFKEVTFKGARNSAKWVGETFWVIKKLGNKSKIIKHNSNPIKTSYELLWKEISDINHVSNITVFNTLRRILEYYFNTIGGINYEECINKFEGEEQFICKSLLSWINDGSHSTHDDLVFHVESEDVQRYLEIFRLVFDKMDHISHYDMMMRVVND
ncbi:AAA family ATPase [Spirosoma foliorum]|uniref:AAA family ATPase n=1 Tax=Spirosoma foliorum TaxID=2710596 RepID=A0A7G5H2W1_9BACT|nr:AAA family ATPase [Spirosoma foliorum]QMW05453.1 AAA family ATPase [Spirosoma foliorum]